jgi:hypothetical protein
MLVEDSSGYRGIAPVWRWPSFTAAENSRLWRYLYQIKTALLPVDARCSPIVLESPSASLRHKQTINGAGRRRISFAPYIYRLDGRPPFRTPDIPGCFQTNERRAKPSLPPNWPVERGQAWAKAWDTEGFGALLMQHAADLPLLAPHCASPVSRHVQVLYGSSAARGYAGIHAVDIEMSLPAILAVIISFDNVQCQSLVDAYNLEYARSGLRLSLLLVVPSASTCIMSLLS